MNSLVELRELSIKLEDISRDSFVDIQKTYTCTSQRKKEYSIIFLGTGQGTHNIASRGLQRIRKSRRVSGPIITTPEAAIWIDPGPDCLEAINFVDIDPRHIDAIFISHAHADHIGNLICATELISGATEIKKKSSLYGNTTAIQGGLDNPSFIDDYHSTVVLKEVGVLDVGDTKFIKDIQVTAIPCHHKETKHSDNSINFRISVSINDEKFVISHIDGNIFVPQANGDPSDKLYLDVIKSCENSDVLIANVANHVRMRTSRQNYPSTKGLINLLREIDPAIAFTTHFGIEMMNLNDAGMRLLSKYDYNDLIDFQQAYVQAELKDCGCLCKVLAADDFMKVLIEDKQIKIYSRQTGVAVSIYR